MLGLALPLTGSPWSSFHGAHERRLGGHARPALTLCNGYSVKSRAIIVVESYLDRPPSQEGSTAVARAAG